MYTSFHHSTADSSSSSFNGLTLVATPIGNLGDFSPRAIETLTKADLILCEDTRTTAALLHKYSITTQTEALHEHNERHRIPSLITSLQSGKNIALVSDAGMPLLSDPGFQLVQAAIKADIPLTAIPGANAALTALVLSGLPPYPFLFSGFPPSRQNARKKSFTHIQTAEQNGLTATLIWYEAPHRLRETLEDMICIFGADRPAAVTRELTKRFEEVRRGTLSELALFYTHHAPRGEITLLLGPPLKNTPTTPSQNLDIVLLSLLERHSLKEASRLLASITGTSKRALYTRALALTHKQKPSSLPLPNQDDMH